jgi:hypothetical protein
MSDASVVAWDRFSHDPRSSQNAALRASDLDRNVALDALSEAYADGRLDRGEYDERSTSVQTGKTLGELASTLRDLAPDPASGSMVLSSDRQLQSRAEQRYAQARRNALTAFLIPNLICWAIWVFTSFHEIGFDPVFAWPIFVTLGTSIRLVQVLLNRQSMVESIKAKEQRKEQRRIEERPR